jgi:hypothetical protein
MRLWELETSGRSLERRIWENRFKQGDIMPILSPISNNLTFQQPDIYKGAAALGQGIQAISAGLDKRQFNQERKAFNDGLQKPSGYMPPGDQMEADRAANGGYEGLGDAWEKERMRAMQDTQAARFASFGGNTSGYDNIRNREVAEAAATAKREHEMEMLEAKQNADEIAKQAELLEKTQKDLSPHDRTLMSILEKGIQTEDDKARAWDAYSSVRGIKGADADLESMVGLAGDQTKFFNELKQSIKPNSTKAIEAIIQGNLAKGIPLSFAALAEAIGGSPSEKLKFRTDFQRIAQKHLDANKLSDTINAIYYPKQKEAYRQGMGMRQPQAAPEQITEQQFDNYLNSMTDEQLAAFMKRMGIM